jgi:hypothetical protein
MTEAVWLQREAESLTPLSVTIKKRGRWEQEVIPWQKELKR